MYFENNNELLFSTDGGASFISAGFYTPPTTFGLQTFDLSGFSQLENQVEVIFRIVLNGATGSTGSNRIDNLLVSGTSLAAEPMPEPVSLFLLGSGIAGMAGTLRRGRKTEGSERGRDTG